MDKWIREDLYLYFKNFDNHIYVFQAYIFFVLLILSIKFLVYGGYKTQYAMFKIFAKDIKDKSEIKETKYRLLNKILKDYINASNKGVFELNVSEIVEKNMLSLKMIGISYDSLSAFVEKGSIAVVLVGTLLSFSYENYKYVYLLSTIISCLLFLITNLFFDIKRAKDKVFLNLTQYIKREVGQFYSSDTTTVLNRLKIDLAQAIVNQSTSINESIMKMGENTAGVLRLSLQEINKSVENALVDLKELTNTITILSNDVKANSQYVSIEKQLSYIEKNQSILEESLQKFESSLENITQRLGDGFGNIASYHLSNATELLNEAITDNIKQIIDLNNTTLIKLQELFETMLAQSKSETQAIFKIKEQMDLHYEK